MTRRLLALFAPGLLLISCSKPTDVYINHGSPVVQHCCTTIDGASDVICYSSGSDGFEYACRFEPGQKIEVCTKEMAERQEREAKKKRSRSDDSRLLFAPHA